MVVLMLKYAEQCKKTDKNRTVRINAELSSMHQEVLDLSALPQGLYAVRLRCGQHVCNGKVAVR